MVEYSERTPCDDKVDQLSQLRREKTALIAKLKKQREKQGHLREVLKGEGDGNFTLKRVKAERQLRKMESETRRMEQALSDTRRQIETTEKEIHDGLSRRKAAVFPWQEKAVQLIELHNYVGDGRGTVAIGDKKRSSVVCTTAGATISTHELQKQLCAAGFKVGKRQLQRFIHERCGVIGQQGQRTDL
jgi:hypothetical protein